MQAVGGAEGLEARWQFLFLYSGRTLLRMSIQLPKEFLLKPLLDKASQRAEVRGPLLHLALQEGSWLSPPFFPSVPGGLCVRSPWQEQEAATPWLLVPSPVPSLKRSQCSSPGRASFPTPPPSNPDMPQGCCIPSPIIFSLTAVTGKFPTARM